MNSCNDYERIRKKLKKKEKNTNFVMCKVQPDHKE